MDSVLSNLPLALAVATAAAGVAQLALSRRMDLGGLTLSLGLAAVAAGPPGLEASLLLIVAAVGAALGWRAGAAHGVGRPDLMGWVLATGAITLLAPTWMPTVVADASPVAIVWGGQVVTVLAGALTVPLARERRGLAGQRVFHYRQVPITGPEERL